MLLREVSGAFRPHQLACLMGASGAGKTTLMDCLAGRKTSKKKKKTSFCFFCDHDRSLFSKRQAGARKTSTPTLIRMQ